MVFLAQSGVVFLLKGRRGATELIFSGLQFSPVMSAQLQHPD